MPFSEIYRTIVNAANPAPYLRDGMSEWLHFRVVAAATPRVKTTDVSFRSRLPLLRYASFKYTHFFNARSEPFLLSTHKYELLKMILCNHVLTFPMHNDPASSVNWSHAHLRYNTVLHSKA